MTKIKRAIFCGFLIIRRIDRLKSFSLLHVTAYDRRKTLRNLRSKIKRNCGYLISLYLKE